ncbi:hypothetical protein WJM97_07520 [Okeanomitos corallinicola TIOX110]|uniref:Uncharacterized protein n=1 Tax=Okeanomitos corallinicola TIOX110 TaxID=3133117 RepID=A0ABZ2UVV4_9CYAN
MAKKESLVQAIQTILNHWRSFPNVTSEGKYEFLTQTVFADSVESHHLLGISEDITLNLELVRKVHKVFIHEITHWLDHTSTLWGQKNLITIFNALNAWKREEEEELWRIIELFAEIGKNEFNDYYKVFGPAINDSKIKIPWRYQYSFGLQYGSDGRIRQDRPFVTTRFYTPENILISRVPISVVSLIEAIATSSELELEYSFILPMLKGKLNEFEFLIESKLFEQKMIDRLYNPYLTVYSVATHCLANYIGIDEIGIAYKLSSALSSLCLNLPDSIFDKFKIPNYDQDIFKERAYHMISRRDRGFAFFVLCQYAPKLNDTDILNWLENTVKSAGLPSISELQNMAGEEMSNLKNTIIDGYFTSHLENLLEIGQENYKKRGIYGKHEPCLTSLLLGSQEIKLPPIILGDGEIFDLDAAFGRVKRTSDDTEKWVFEIWDIESKLREFQRACTF